MLQVKQLESVRKIDRESWKQQLLLHYYYYYLYIVDEQLAGENVWPWDEEELLQHMVPLMR
jgi:hypothetical protein